MLKTSHLIAFAAGAVLAAAAGGAQAAVTVLGGGMAQACSKAALGGESDSKSEDMCTLAAQPARPGRHLCEPGRAQAAPA